MSDHTPARRGEVEIEFRVAPYGEHEPTLTAVASSNWPSHDQGIEFIVSNPGADSEASIKLSAREAAKLARWITDTLGTVNHA